MQYFLNPWWHQQNNARAFAQQGGLGLGGRQPYFCSYGQESCCWHPPAEANGGRTALLKYLFQECAALCHSQEPTIALGGPAEPSCTRHPSAGLTVKEI